MRDKYGLLPPVIRHNLEREEMVDRQVRAAAGLYAALQAKDRRLDLQFITARADPEYGVVPGRWHVVRRNEGAVPDSYMAITTADGGYREPDFGVLKDLDERDLWRHGIPDKERKSDLPLQREQERDELISDVRAGLRVAGEGGMNKRLWGRK